jgi:phospholipid/cholesterol/gamma-HCH transport system substrate-binding protein
MQSRAMEILVGLFVCLGVGAILILTLRVASVQDIGGDGSSYQVHAKFANVGKLAVGNSVKIAGVTIGRVSAITVDPHDFQARVSMRIAGQYNNIPGDVDARILTAGLLGEQYVSLQEGGALDPLKDGDSITLTQSAFVLENLIGEFVSNMASKPQE